MSTFSELKQLRQQRHDIVAGAGALLTTAAKAGRSLNSDELRTFEARHTEADKLLERINLLEKQSDVERSMVVTDTRMAGRQDFIQPGWEHRSQSGSADAYERRASTNEINEIRSYLLDRLSPDVEGRALSAISGAGGGYMVPQGFIYELEVALKQYGGMMSVARVYPTEMGNQLPYPSMNDTQNTGEITGENQDVTGSGDSGAASEVDMAFGVTIFNSYMVDSGIIQIPVQLMEDAAFDVDTWLTEAVTVRLGRKLNTLFTVGTGSNQPTGLVTALSAGAYYQSTNTANITYNDLLNVEHAVDPAYRARPGVRWMFNDTTLKQLKQLTDNNGRPLWLAGGVSEGPVNRAPDMIDGYPYTINQDMPSYGVSGNIPIVFGDFQKYVVRQVRQVSLQRFEERYMTQLRKGFLAFQRYDGNVIDAGTHPLKGLRLQ